MSDDREIRWPKRFIVISVACALACLALLFAEFKAATPDESEYLRLEALATGGMAQVSDQCRPYHTYRRSGYPHFKDNEFVQEVIVFYHCESEEVKETVMSAYYSNTETGIRFAEVEFLNGFGSEPIPLPSGVTDTDVVAEARSARGPRSLLQWIAFEMN